MLLFLISDVPVVPLPASQEDGDSNTKYIIIGIVSGLVLLALLILLLILLCRKKKRTDPEPYSAPAYANATYADVEGRGAASGRRDSGHYDDTEVVKKKEGAVGIANPGYEDEKKKPIDGAVGGSNPYEEIPYDTVGKGLQDTDKKFDGYEEPMQVVGMASYTTGPIRKTETERRIPTWWRHLSTRRSRPLERWRRTPGPRPTGQQRAPGSTSGGSRA